MKKITAIMLIVLFVAMLTACGASDRPEVTEAPAEAVEAAAETAADEVAETAAETQRDWAMTVMLGPDPDYEGSVTYAELEVVKKKLESRLSEAKVSEFEVTVDDSSAPRITMALNEKLSDNEVEEIITFDDKLTFRNEDGDILMDESYVESATASVDNDMNGYVTLRFTESGKEKFAQITEEYVNHRIEVYLNAELLSAPMVNDAITDGNAEIFGGFTQEEAAKMADDINSALLDFGLTVVQN